MQRDISLELQTGFEMPALFSVTRRVEFADTDMAGIVHFANFFRFFEEAEHALFRSFGSTIMDKQPDGSVISWPRVGASISFDTPAHYDQLIEVRLAGLTMGNSSLTMQWEAWYGETRLCHGELKTVCCAFRPGEKMTAIAIPSNLRTALQQIADDGK